MKKAKDSEIKKNILCVYETFQKISQLITWKSRIKWICLRILVDYNIIDSSNIIDTEWKYSMKYWYLMKNGIKWNNIWVNWKIIYSIIK